MVDIILRPSSHYSLRTDLSLDTPLYGHNQ